MARVNKVFAGPATRNSPQVRELPAAAAITPGRIIVATAGAFALAGAATVGKVYVAQENYLAQEGVDTDYAVGDVCIGMELDPSCFFHARVAATTVVTLDAPLAPGANGELVLAGAADQVVAFADEALTVGASADLVRVRPATGYSSAA